MELVLAEDCRGLEKSNFHSHHSTMLKMQIEKSSNKSDEEPFSNERKELTA